MCHRVPRIVIAVTAWEDYNADLHASVMYFRYAPLTAGAAAFFRLARLFSTGGCRSLFLSAGSTIEVMNFFSP
ncbi:MAG TPA: hypothetical protein VGL97_18640 [Bryobacteraceae bacterium]